MSACATCGECAGGLEFGIAICDGALLAALVAARRPELSLFVNCCGPPWERLPASLRDGAPMIEVPSIHLLGRRDEMLSEDELMSLPKQCGDGGERRGGGEAAAAEALRKALRIEGQA